MQYSFSRSLLLIPIFLLLVSGAGRHDVSLDAYYELAKDPAFACAGELFLGNEPVSSCVLIGKRYVMTTAHSLREGSRKTVTKSVSTPVGLRPMQVPAHMYTSKPEKIRVKLDNKIYRCKQLFIHPMYSDTFGSFGDYDIAILELEEEVTGIGIPALYNGNMLNKRGITVGCGEVGTGDDYNGRKKYKTHKMAGENMIDSITELNLWADMDHPDSAMFNRIGNAKPLPLEYMGLQGDCGSPLFVQEDNAYYLAGISFAPAYFDDMYYFGKLHGTNYGFITGWTKISVIREWMDKIITK